MRRHIVIVAFCALGTALTGWLTRNPVSAQAEPPPCDFTTGGGYIFPGAPSTDDKGTFGVAGGCKHGSGLGTPPGPYWGHLQYHDHALDLRVHWTSITAYMIDTVVFPDPRARLICGTAETNFGPVDFVVRTEDDGNPGTNDEFDIQLQGAVVYSTFAGGPHKLGGGFGGGGNIELHKPNPSTTGVFGGLCPALGIPLPQDSNVSVTKTAVEAVVDVGEQASFNITVVAEGPGVSTNVTLVDELPARPAGFEFTLTGEDAGSCTITSVPVGGGTQQTVTCSFGTVPAGDDRTITVTTSADITVCGEGGGGLTNTATVTADADSDLADNSSTASIQVNCPPE